LCRIYQAATEEKALEALERVTAKWSEKYPHSMKSWKQNWGQVYGELSIMYEGRLLK
jgi:transposase-like protein